MCSLKYSKSLLPFVITFIVGLFVANIFFSFTASNKVIKSQVNEVKTYKTYKKKKKRCRKNKRVYSVESYDDKRIVTPTFEQTIEINKEVKRSGK